MLPLRGCRCACAGRRRCSCCCFAACWPRCRARAGGALAPAAAPTRCPPSTPSDIALTLFLNSISKFYLHLCRLLRRRRPLRQGASQLHPATVLFPPSSCPDDGAAGHPRRQIRRRHRRHGVATHSATFGALPPGATQEASFWLGGPRPSSCQRSACVVTRPGAALRRA
jgi:hypothetical protein